MLVLKTYPHPLELRTARTLLRQWKEGDLPLWAEMNADLDVRRHFPSLSTPMQAYAEAGRMRDAISQRGWGMWALELPGRMAFAGTIGLYVTAIEAPFVPAVELGWRLRREAWGQGFAREAAQAAAQFAFDHLELQQVVAYTTTTNVRSQRVMESLGMRHDPNDDFDHPLIEPGHPLRRHLLYRMSRREPLPEELPACIV
jgi:RimJ/RimL family protein N-acetyltransferase